MTIKREFVPLETLVSAERLQLADGFDLEKFRHSTTVRGKRLDWLGISRRLLWMASGHEHIEPELLDWIDLIPRGEVMYDIGASNGIFALYAAACGLRVTAIEPDPANYFLLSYNNYLNARAHGFELEGCYNLAVSDTMGVGRMHIRRMELGGHEKILDKAQDVFGHTFLAEHTHPVLKCSLDGLVSVTKLPPPAYLKIDVDGAEAEVLAGAEECLKRVRSVFIELTEDFLQEFAQDFFTRRGFALIGREQVQNYAGLYNCVFEHKVGA